MRKISAAMLGISLLAAAGDNAFAHAHLVTAEPAVDASVTTPPTEVAINFTEGVEPRFSAIEVRDAADQRVDGADPHTAGTDVKRLVVSLKPLPPGTYTVTWHATAIDTHKTDGTFHFTVRP